VTKRERANEEREEEVIKRAREKVEKIERKR